MRTPRKFCCGTAALRMSVGRIRQNKSTATSVSRSAMSTALSRDGPSLEIDRYVMSAPAATAAATSKATTIGRETPSTKSPC